MRAGTQRSEQVLSEGTLFTVLKAYIPDIEELIDHADLRAAAAYAAQTILTRTGDTNGLG